MNKDRQNTPKAVQDCHDLLAWIIPQLDKFPRLRRYTLGERIEDALLDVLEKLITAAYSRTKQDSLQSANRRLDIVRHLWRLGHTLKVVSTRSYEHGVRLMLELGRQIGGWQQASRA